jgi:hypothetical protein
MSTLGLLCFVFINSDDEGSEEEGEGEDDEEEYDEDDNDEDYEDEDEEEEDEDVESPSFFFGQNPIQQQAWNNFQFGNVKTSSAQPESVSGLSSMLANINVCSPFSFGLQSTTVVIFLFPSLSFNKKFLFNRPTKINGQHLLILIKLKNI